MAEPEKNKDFAALRLVAVVFAFLIAVAYVPRLVGGGCGRMTGKDAPEFTATVVLNGQPGQTKMALSELRGKVVVLDFWATWCGPCRAEAPIMNALYQRHKTEGVVVVGVNTDDEDGNAGRYAKEHGLTFPIAYDADRSAARAYNVSSLPTLVVISKTGKVVAFRSGVTTDSELEELIKQAEAS